MTESKKIYIVDNKDHNKVIAILADHHFTEPEPIVCKWCGSNEVMKYGIREGKQEYICNKCRRKFNADDTPYKKLSPVDQIGLALSNFYDGLSFADIARMLEQSFNNPVNESTVYRWIISYTTKAITYTEPLKPKVSDTWIVDETVIKVGGDNLWFWDVICADTKFLITSHLSKSRTTKDVMTLFNRAHKKTDVIPHFIVSDGLNAYIDGIERLFGADTHHIQSRGFTDDVNTNIIERFHGTIKDRTKVVRGFKSYDTAELIMDGFLVHYNYFRPHMTLSNKTPAQVAGLKIPFKTWTDFVRADNG